MAKGELVFPSDVKTEGDFQSFLETRIERATSSVLALRARLHDLPEGKEKEFVYSQLSGVEQKLGADIVEAKIRLGS